MVGLTFLAVMPPSGSEGAAVPAESRWYSHLSAGATERPEILSSVSQMSVLARGAVGITAASRSAVFLIGSDCRLDDYAHAA